MTTRRRGIFPPQCFNCNRRQHARNQFPNTKEINFQQLTCGSISFRRKWCLFSRDDITEGNSVTLCPECLHCVDTSTKSDPGDWRYIWAPYFWNFLQDDSIVRHLGNGAWKYIPTAWRPWWMHSLPEKVALYQDDNGLTCDHLYTYPEPYFMDVTEHRDQLLGMVERLQLGEMKRVIDELLYPTVLCPWGCTEYKHQAGLLPIDAVIQNSLRCIDIPMTIEGRKKVYHCRSGRLDYLQGEHHCLLLNPEWEVWPSIVFDLKKGLQCLTCRHHSGGTTKKFIHPPTLPHCIPSAYADQLSHAVLQSRTIKPTRASAYTTSYQLMEQRGSFAGIDTCGVSMYGRYNLKSHLLECAESLSLQCRADIRVLLSQLMDDGKIDPCVGDIMLNDSRCRYPDAAKTRELYCKGATYIRYTDCIRLQKELSLADQITVDNIRAQKTVTFRPNWFKSMVFIHTCDEFGSFFDEVPTFVAKRQKTKGHEDFSLVWTLLSLISSVPVLYEVLTSCVATSDDWTGAILSYISASVFTSRSRSGISKNDVFAMYRKARAKKLMDLINLQRQKYTPYLLKQILVGAMEPFHEPYQRVCTFSYRLNSDGELGSQIGNHIQECHEIVLIFNENQSTSLGHLPPELVTLGCGREFQLVYITAVRSGQSTSDQQNDCVSFMRHGFNFPGWWRASRCQTYNQQVPFHIADFLSDICWGVLAYTDVTLEPKELMRDQYMCHVGGQVEFSCPEHGFPLISGCTGDAIRCSTVGCTKAVRHKCLVKDCRYVYCRTCFGQLNSVMLDEEHVSDNENNNNDSDNSWISGVDDVSEASTMSLGSGEEYLIDSDLDASPVGDDTSWSQDSNDSQHAYKDSDSDTSSSTCDGVLRVDMYHVDDDGEEFVTGANEPIFDMLLGYSDNEEDSNNAMELSPVPTTVAHKQDMQSVVLDPTSTYIPGHALINGVGSLLVRRHHDNDATLRQTEFLQNICARQKGTVVPLIYPEAMLFPSIFPYDNGSDGSIVGAMPSAILSQRRQQNDIGIASLHEHMRTRQLLCSSKTASCYRYIGFAFDCMTQAALQNSDTRLVLNRGFVESTNHTGLKLRNKEDGQFSDSFDNRQMVNSLTAAQKYNTSNLFTTFTCNMKLLFGLRRIEQWLLGSEACENYIYSNEFSDHTEAEFRNGLREVAANLLNRNWLEIRQLIMKYFLKSPEKPVMPVRSIFWRDEYQGKKGNVCHGHILMEVIYDENSEEQRHEFEDLIRGFIGDIVRIDELEGLVAEGILRDSDDWIEMRDTAARILTQKTRRHMKRIGTGDSDLGKRYKDNYYLNPRPTMHSCVEMDIKHSHEAVAIMCQLGLADPPPSNEPNKFIPTHPLLKSFSHIPPAEMKDGSMSPVHGRLYAATECMWNFQRVTSYTLARYVTKYILKKDDNCHISYNADNRVENGVSMKASFLYNTKVSSTAYHQKQRQETSRSRKHPEGRSISRHEMLQIILSDPQVHTNLRFVNIPTTPLEQRAGVDRVPRCDTEKEPDSRLDAYRQACGSDTVEFVINADYVRRKRFPQDDWRQFTNSQMLLMSDLSYSRVSIDLVTVFGLRPPELRATFSSMSMYFRWFHRDECLTSEEIMELTMKKDKFEDSLWYDGRGRQVRLFSGAFLDGINHVLDDGLKQHRIPSPLRKLLHDMIRYHSAIGFTGTTNGNDSRGTFSCNNNGTLTQAERLRWLTLQKNFVYFDKEAYNARGNDGSDGLLPIPVFSNIKPTQQSRFLYHILLSMGHFDTEIDVLVNRNLLECFIEAGLVVPNEPTQTSVDRILKRYMLEQLCYYPVSTQTFDLYLVTAQEVLTMTLGGEGMPIDEIPACLYTEIQERGCNDLYERMMKMRTNAITAAHREISDGLHSPEEHIPPLETFLHDKHMTPWSGTLPKCDNQTDDSHQEQQEVVQAMASMIASYSDRSRRTLTKSLLVAGGPGCGKTFSLLNGVLMSTSQGLFILPMAILADRALQIGGVHFHSIFRYPITNGSAQRLAELALIKILAKPIYAAILRHIDVIAFDEFGNMSAENLSAIDIIFRRIRGLNSFMGGVVILATMDDKQIQPINGFPILLSPHIISCFHVRLLEHSVRAASDSNLRRINEIQRMPSASITANKELVKEFRDLISEHCTFVRDWNDPIIDSTVLRVFTRNGPAREALEKVLRDVPRVHGPANVTKRQAEDTFLPIGALSQTTCSPASRDVKQQLTKCVKEPENLLFFKNAMYQFTFNDLQNYEFSQSRLAILIDVPGQDELDKFKKIEVFAAPPGVRAPPSNGDITREVLMDKGWTPVRIGPCPLYRHSLTALGVKASRRQYGLRHYVSSSLNSVQGATLSRMATEISCRKKLYRIWEKGQNVVLTSRTKTAGGLIFVGEDKADILDMLCEALCMKSQYSDYMEHVLKVLAGNVMERNQAPVIRTTLHPYRSCDIPLPRDISGYSYMLLSARDWSTIYIGETDLLHKRLMQHNSGYGSKQTAPEHKRPWILVTYVTGFDGNKETRLAFEKEWQRQAKRAVVRNNNNRNVASVARIAADVIEDFQHSTPGLSLRQVYHSKIAET